MKADGTVWSWGLNQYGQLGNGTTTTAKVAVQVSNLAGAKAVSAGAYHSYALKADASASAWGWNSYGQLGDGTTTNRSAPVPVSGLSGVAAIEGGRHFGLATKIDGTVWGWGYNNAGQLGTGTTTKPNNGQLTPVQSKFSGGVVQGTRTSANYTYNGDGLRTSKTSGGATSAFVWAVADSVPPLLSDGSTALIYGPSGAFKQIDSNGAATYLHTDQIGSTRLISNPTGDVVATYTFDAHGNQTAKSGAASTMMGFAGQYTDAETGFQYLRARYYDPATGQFLNRDPLVGLSGHPYTYALNNPLTYTDPLGLISFRDVAKAVTKVVKTGSQVIEVGALVVAGGAAIIPGGQVVAGGALFVSGVAGGVNTLATCAEYAALGGSRSGCLTSIAVDVGTAGIGRLVTPGLVKKGKKIYTPAERGIQAGIGLTGEFVEWAIGYAPDDDYRMGQVGCDPIPRFESSL